MLIGRVSERRQVESLVAAGRIGQSGVLVVTGEAGIGKTALLDYAAAVAAEGMTVRRITGAEAERDLPFAGLAQLLRPSVTDLSRLPEPQAQALGVALALRAGSGADRFAVGAGTLSLLTRMSEDRPLCLIIDDAQLVDRPSQEALAFVTRRLLADAIVVFVAVRAGEPSLLAAADLPELRMAGIDPMATRELVQARRDGPVSTALAERMFAATGGNPLAIQELVTDPDQLLALPSDAPVPIPVALAELYARRARDLNPAATTALLVAAAAGEDLGVVARACTALGVDVSALAAAESAGLVTVEADRVRFGHPLIRSGLYASVDPARRRALHAAIAAAIGDADPDRRAWHRYEAAIGPDEDTAAEVAAVGQRAADRGAFAVASTAAERAARLSPDGARRVDRLLAAGTWAWQAGDAARATALLDRTARWDRSPAVGARTARLRGVIAVRCGSVGQARDILMAAGAGSASASEAIACYAEAISACFYLGDTVQAVVAARQIEALLSDEQAGGNVLGPIAAGMARVIAGEDGADLIRTGLQRGRRWDGGDDPSLDLDTWLVLGSMFIRDSTTGRDLIQQAVTDRRAESAVGALPHLLFHLARDAATTDRWSGAEADYTEAIALAREFGQTTELAVSLSGLAWLEARQGRAAAATGHAAEADALSRSHDLHLGRIWAEFALGDLALGLGDIAAAVQRYQRLEQSLHDLGMRDVDVSPGPELIEALLRSGDQPAAEALATAYGRRAAAKGQPWALARAARADALLCADDRVDRAFGRALELHGSTLDTYEGARTRLAYGARLRRLRRRVDARPHLQTALAAFTRLGARPWADSAADELAATGVTPHRPDQQPASQLTPRELQISVLLAQGRTTRQVASALFLSPKTVEYHLRHVYTKFGIDSRSELAARISER